MEFLSIPFVVCLVLTFVLYYMRTGRRWQHGVLLLASCVFIGYYHLVYLLFALGITLLTFYAGLWLHRKRDTRLAPWIFGGSVGALVGIWLVARYWSPLFPLGISFYTFQALSYLIEIYWDEEPERSLPDFTLYMLLFMKFLSGPIERGFDLLPQLKAGKAFSYDRVVDGMKVVAWGAFLKLVIADRIAPSLDGVFDAPDGFGHAVAHGHDALSHPALCRLCRIHLHGHRLRADVRFPIVTQLQPSVSLANHR